MEINEIVFKLEGTVLFSPAQRCLNGPNGSIAILTENNLRFLQLLLNGVTEKEQIINQVWKEQRGAISESSYYGQLYMLRKAFVQVGLKESLIHTIPRKGVRYTGSVTQVTINQQPEIQQHSKEQKTMEPDMHQVGVATAPFNNTVIPVSKRVVRQSFLQSYRWKKLISLLAFFSFCWLSFLSALIIIILLNGDTP
ncbi:winged helix-turn-helix domain-containing protein [Yersinia aldovae]|uniref:Membrane protein n=1 Tax=Yersinia aldovae TaxID=29483 RepID=A0ABM9SVH3_YERAL|nr:membrane protein [Yersinia aldovae]CNJ77505.1 membrane protein [Yersinia aldovae]CNL33890.1 membrane protein [Yersinia aldovae]